MTDRPLNETTWVYYDGACGLCHKFVRFCLNRDDTGDAFRFSPLGGEHFRAHVAMSDRATLPDSVLVRTREGALLTRSDGILYVLRQLGGGWRLLAAVSRPFPRFLRDRGYDLVARIRRRLFPPPTDVCPPMPPRLRERFVP